MILGRVDMVGLGSGLDGNWVGYGYVLIWFCYRRFIFTLEGKDSVHDNTSPTVVIPPKARHTFKADPSYEGECEVHSMYPSSLTNLNLLTLT